jgi:Uma2 family endonuclease
MEALRIDRRYTYADYCTWGDDVRYELIDGVAYAMSPAPLRKHQKISMRLSHQLAGFLEGKPCEVYAAPFEVRLNADGEDDTVVQPDLVVVCDRAKLSDAGCTGAPDMVIEILSQSTAARDRVQKFSLYLRTGVREYWIVDPDSKTVSAYLLSGSQYVAHSYADDDVAPVNVLDGCMIDLRDVFEE